MLDIETFKQETSKLIAARKQIELKEYNIENELVAKFNNNEFGEMIPKLVTKSYMLELLSNSAIEPSVHVEKSILISNLNNFTTELQVFCAWRAIHEYVESQVSNEYDALEKSSDDLLAKYGVTVDEEKERDAFSSNANPSIAAYLNSQDFDDDDQDQVLYPNINYDALKVWASGNVYLVKDIAGEPGMAFVEIIY